MKLRFVLSLAVLATGCGDDAASDVPDAAMDSPAVLADAGVDVQSDGSTTDASTDASIDAASDAPLSKWILTWSDEFNTGTVPNPMYWTPETGGGGWGNHEREFYTGDP